jgi:arylsulfatase A-like enzyme
MNGYPNVFVKDHRVYKLDPKDPIAGKSGGVAARLDYDHISRDLANEAIGFIKQHQKEPFFLYFPMNQVHHPIHPAPQFKGTSEVGRYGDYIHDLDWSVGQVLETLDRLDLNKKTLVIFTSDNGAYDKGQKAGSAPGMDEDVPDESAFNFKRNAPWSGYKVGVLMGGYRVPFLVRWTNRIPSGKTSDNLVCLTDIYATLAELLGYSIVPGNAPDSISFLTELLNRDQKPASQAREAMVYQSGPGYFGVREKNWALVLGASYIFDGKEVKVQEQLFDLSVDPQQKSNGSREHPEVVARLRGIFDVIKGSGRASEARDAKRKP